MYFTKDLRQATLGKDRRSVSRGLAGAFPSSLSSSSYTGSNSHQPSSYLRCSTFDGDFNTKSNLDPLASTRSSSSSSSEAQLVVRIQPSSFQEDEALQSDSDLSLVGSGGDEFNGFFSPLDFDEPRSTLPSLSPSSLPRSSLPHSSAPSTLPIPSPLLLQSFDSTRPVNWNSSEWDSLNPFANEGLPKDKNDALGKPTAGFAIIKSSEEIRTLKACQACKARKSKCDGKSSCIRCENKGIPCVYVARSPRVRGKQTRRASSSSLLSPPLFSHSLDHRRSSASSSFIQKPEPGISRSRRRVSDGSRWGREGQLGDEGESSLVLGDDESERREVKPFEFRLDEGGCHRRRQRPSTDPSQPSLAAVAVPFGSSLSVPPAHEHYHQSYQSSFISPGSHYDQHIQPPHPLQQPHLFVAVAPQPPYSHPSHFHPSEDRSHSLTPDYSPLSIPSSLDPQDLTHPLEPHSLLFGESDASFDLDFQQLPSHLFPHHCNEPLAQSHSAYHRFDDRPSFPSGWFPSSNSSLEACPRPVLFGGGSSMANYRTSAQQVWGQGSWEEC